MANMIDKLKHAPFGADLTRNVIARENLNKKKKL